MTDRRIHAWRWSTSVSGTILSWCGIHLRGRKYTVNSNEVTCADCHIALQRHHEMAVGKGEP